MKPDYLRTSICDAGCDLVFSRLQAAHLFIDLPSTLAWLITNSIMAPQAFSIPDILPIWQRRAHFKSTSDSLFARLVVALNGQFDVADLFGVVELILNTIRDPSFDLASLSFQSAEDVDRNILEYNSELGKQRASPESGLHIAMGCVIDHIAARMDERFDRSECYSNDGRHFSRAQRWDSIKAVKDDQNDLRSVALVHPLWTGCALAAHQRLAIIHPLQHSDQETEYLDSPAIGPWVRRLDYGLHVVLSKHLYKKEDGSWFYPNDDFLEELNSVPEEDFVERVSDFLQKREEVIPLLFSRLTNLSDLYLRVGRVLVYSNYGFSREACERIESQMGDVAATTIQSLGFLNHLRSLHLSQYSIENLNEIPFWQESSPWLLQLCEILPHLKVLEILELDNWDFGILPLHIDLPDQLKSTSPPSSLKSFRLRQEASTMEEFPLYNVAEMSIFPVALMGWLISPRGEFSLRSLYVKLGGAMSNNGRVADAGLIAALPSALPAIEELELDFSHLEVRTELAHGLLPSLLSYCTSLRCYIQTQLSFKYTDDSLPAHMRGIYVHYPPWTTEIFGIHTLYGYEDLHYLGPLLENGSNIRRFVVQDMDRKIEQDVREICEEHGVEFSIGDVSV